MATDIRARSQELSDAWGVGYRPTSGISSRVRLAGTPVDNGDGTCTIVFVITVQTNAASFGTGITYYADIIISGTAYRRTIKSSSATWAANRTYNVQHSVTFPMTGNAQRTARLVITGSGGSALDLDSHPQGGTTLDNVPVLAGYVYIQAGSSVVRGEVWIGDESGTPVRAKEVWIGDESGVPRKATI